MNEEYRFSLSGYQIVDIDIVYLDVVTGYCWMHRFLLIGPLLRFRVFRPAAEITE